MSKADDTYNQVREYLADRDNPLFNLPARKGFALLEELSALYRLAKIDEQRPEKPERVYHIEQRAVMMLPPVDASLVEGIDFDLLLRELRRRLFGAVAVPGGLETTMTNATTYPFGPGAGFPSPVIPAYEYLAVEGSEQSPDGRWLDPAAPDADRTPNVDPSADAEAQAQSEADPEASGHLP